METSKLKKFAQFARRSLLEQVTAKLKLVLADESPARRERPQAIKKLEEAVTDQGKEQVIERVAYIWFNRFCALRFMDVNRYNRIGIVSPAEGQFQPEILADAKMGHIDEDMVSEPTRQKIFALLDGKTPSQDPQGEAYRLLVVAACNYWYSAMPFLFERIDDYTELLMPDDLLSGNSILAYTREAMTPDACKDVEVIGWLYQFYISEKKDQVFADLKKNKKVTPENIPAATQLFTPHWIVRYLVENSLGRLWMLNRPDSGLVEQMDYYIKPDESETDYLRISSPEEIKICDPACGSGHMLTYAFDLLYAIYEEEGYEPSEIPEKILTNNLYGIEIDERAGELAAFALTMKARAKQRRFFRKPVQPNVVILENVTFAESEMQDVAALVGKDLFTDELRETLNQFGQAKSFGSLIVPKVRNPTETLRMLETGDFHDDLLLKELQARVMTVLRMAEALSPKYHVVVANPPYLGARAFGDIHKGWFAQNYPKGRSDYFAAFILRGWSLALTSGYSSMVTMEAWMFLAAFEALRTEMLKVASIQSMIHMPYLGKGGTSMGINFGTTAFTLKTRPHQSAGKFFCLRYYESDQNGIPNRFPPENERTKNRRSSDFEKIPGSPISYWVSETLLSSFEEASLDDFLFSEGPCKTGDDDIYLRLHWEINASSVSHEKKWCLCSKGGEFRKFYGNLEHVIRWDEPTRAFYRKDKTARITSESVWGERGITWTIVSSSEKYSFRMLPENTRFNSVSPTVFSKTSVNEVNASLGLLNSAVAQTILGLLNPTLALNVGNVLSMPVKKRSAAEMLVPDILELSKPDWDAYETSWDFTTLPLLSQDHRSKTIVSRYADLRAQWREATLEMQWLEKENNRIFIDAYGLQDELTPDVPLEEITLTCNPHYRYGNKKNEEELEALLLADTMRELVSYAVGCMFGRYALDKPGLILANQGETIEDYLKQVPEPSFSADDDNVIPMLDGDWFTDDITERFREFLRIAFGEEHYDENLRFVEQALGKDIRKYFLKDFYNDHVRRYKKRPIYWLFSSPKGSFNALIYMHRYQPHTVGTVLEYLRDFKDEKLQARKNHLEAVSISAGASQGEKTKALKEIEKINRILAELDDYERDVLYPLATEQVEIDLDDGVKANYPKFGEALKKITGLSG